MTHKLLALGQFIVNVNTAFFLGTEGVLFGCLLFSGLLFLVRRRARKVAA